MDRRALLPNVGLLQQAHERDRLHAGKLAELLDWRLDDVAGYLGRATSTVSHNPVSLQYQDQLARLARTLLHAYELMGNDLGLARTWLRMPVPVLERATPKDLIVQGHIDRVESLLDEVQAGFAA